MFSPKYVFSAENEADNNIHAPIKGKISSISVKDGEEVYPGQVLFTIEVAKMFFPVIARKKAIARLYFKKGDIVEPDTIIMQTTARKTQKAGGSIGSDRNQGSTEQEPYTGNSFEQLIKIKSDETFEAIKFDIKAAVKTRKSLNYNKNSSYFIEITGKSENINGSVYLMPQTSFMLPTLTTYFQTKDPSLGITHVPLSPQELDLFEKHKQGQTSWSEAITEEEINIPWANMLHFGNIQKILLFIILVAELFRGHMISMLKKVRNRRDSYQLSIFENKIS